MTGAIQLFQFRGINVFLHWSWALVAVYGIQSRSDRYERVFYAIAEYIGLFVIVLTHEFGHALACRSVGGKADRILLWPFGGVAFVNPPNRPGAQLWSIVAGPLVNVVLLPITFVASFYVDRVLPGANADQRRFVESIAWINLTLLIFNMLPIYPLDGGQTVRSLLWYLVGPIRSLQIAATVGIIGAVGAIGLALYSRDPWLIALAVLGANECWRGLRAARAMTAIKRIPRHDAFSCPGCGESPPVGPFWRCTCGAGFDTFATGFACPNCGARHMQTACPFCRESRPSAAWMPNASGFTPVVREVSRAFDSPSDNSNPPRSI